MLGWVAPSPGHCAVFWRHPPPVPVQIALQTPAAATKGEAKHVVVVAAVADFEVPIVRQSGRWLAPEVASEPRARLRAAVARAVC